jgi:hypothetical protein
MSAEDCDGAFATMQPIGAIGCNGTKKLALQDQEVSAEGFEPSTNGLKGRNP